MQKIKTTEIQLFCSDFFGRKTIFTFLKEINFLRQLKFIF